MWYGNQSAQSRTMLSSLLKTALKIVGVLKSIKVWAGVRTKCVPAHTVWLLPTAVYD